MTTEPDQKSMEVKQNGEITAKDEEVAEIRRPGKGRRTTRATRRERTPKI